MTNPPHNVPERLARVGALLETLCAFVKEHQLYGADHPRAMQTRAAFRAQIQRVIPDAGTQQHLTIAYQGGRYFLENLPLPVRGSALQLLSTTLSARDKAGFRFQLDSSDARLSALVDVFQSVPTAALPPEPPPAAGFAWLTAEELRLLEGGSLRSERRRHLLLGLGDLHINERLYCSAMDSLSNFMESCATGQVEDMSLMANVSDRLVQEFTTSPGAILPLTTVPYHDNFTYYHSLNVSLLTLNAARLVGATEAQLRRIGQAALLHDLGKLDVPLEVLYKPGRLTAAESELVMRHPVTGARRLAGLPNCDPLAIAVAFGHHIKDNGNGYPKVGANFRLGPVTSLLEVVDIFEALTAYRPYKKALTPAQAFEVIYGMSHMQSFRPHIDLLVRAVGFNPIGSRVRTADGEIAVVVRHEGGDPRRPVVRALQGAKGESAPALAGERVVRSADDTGVLEEATVVALDPEQDFALQDSGSP